jgi:hypothetical protein
MTFRTLCSPVFPSPALFPARSWSTPTRIPPRPASARPQLHQLGIYRNHRRLPSTSATCCSRDGVPLLHAAISLMNWSRSSLGLAPTRLRRLRRPSPSDIAKPVHRHQPFTVSTVSKLLLFRIRLSSASSRPVMLVCGPSQRLVSISSCARHTRTRGSKPVPRAH